MSMIMPRQILKKPSDFDFSCEKIDVSDVRIHRCTNHVCVTVLRMSGLTLWDNSLFT